MLYFLFCVWLVAGLKSQVIILYSILSFSILSYHILFYPILSYPFPPYPILSYRLLPWSILFYSAHILIMIKSIFPSTHWYAYPLHSLHLLFCFVLSSPLIFSWRNLIEFCLICQSSLSSFNTSTLPRPRYHHKSLSVFLHLFIFLPLSVAHSFFVSLSVCSLHHSLALSLFISLFFSFPSSLLLCLSPHYLLICIAHYFSLPLPRSLPISLSLIISVSLSPLSRPFYHLFLSLQFRSFFPAPSTFSLCLYQSFWPSFFFFLLTSIQPHTVT